MDLIFTVAEGKSLEVSRLLAQSAAPNVRNSEGHTALMKASINGHLEVVQTLLKPGAESDLKSPSGMTALDFAKRNNHSGIVKLLKSRLRTERLKRK